MKTFSKILIAVLGAPFVLLLLVAAGVRRLFLGAYGAGDDVALVYSQVTWDEVWQRPQQYAWREAELRRVVYCCPVQLHNLLFLGRKWRPVRRFEDGGRRLMVLSPLIFSGHFKSQFWHELNCRIVAWHLGMALDGGARVHLLANTPFALRVIEHCFYGGGGRDDRLARLVYDVIDDFTIFDWSPEFGRGFDERLTGMADVVIAGTNELAQGRENTVFVGCGVDFDLFATRVDLPAALRDLPRPIIGYFGTISERIDLDLIALLADRFAGASVVMVGPVHFPAEMLPEWQNIHYLGLQRHGDLPAFAQGFDVALIPFRITPATVQLNPVKTLEYLAAGLPVVATRLPDLERFYSEVVYIADSREEFAELVEKVLAERDSERTARGVEMARGASWNGMVERIDEALFPAGDVDADLRSAERVAG